MNHTSIEKRARLLANLAQQAKSGAAKPAALDITAIRHFPVREPVSGNRYSLLRITTRSGLIGWGECHYDPNADIKALESTWIGRPANAYATIPPSTPFRAALDMASLDVLGKAANAPVYRILGGPTRSKVRAYSSPQRGDFPVSVIDVPTPIWRNQGKAYQNRILELANAVPADHDFVLAANGFLTPGDAASVATTIESRHPLWFDEPAVFQALLREGLIDLVRPEIGIFGINGTRRIAALAEPYYVAVAPRHNGGPVMTAAAIHIAASIPNFFIQHVPQPKAEEDHGMRREVVSPTLETSKGGFLEVTKSPGLGITVNESALEKYHAS
jgi:galactonate dehydratase